MTGYDCGGKQPTHHRRGRSNADVRRATQVLAQQGQSQPSAGGAILAGSTTREAIEALVARDPFVAEGVVNAEIIEIAPNKASEQLSFLVPA